MLNAVLTVRAHQANSHQGHGWEQFTDACMEILDEAEMREPVLSSLLDAIQLHLDRRAAGAFRVGAVLFSNQYGPLGRTRTAKELLDEWKNG